MACIIPIRTPVGRENRIGKGACLAFSPSLMDSGDPALGGLGLGDLLWSQDWVCGLSFTSSKRRSQRRTLCSSSTQDDWYSSPLLKKSIGSPFAESNKTNAYATFSSWLSRDILLRRIFAYYCAPDRVYTEFPALLPLLTEGIFAGN